MNEISILIATTLARTFLVKSLSSAFKGVSNKLNQRAMKLFNKVLSTGFEMMTFTFQVLLLYHIGEYRTCIDLIDYMKLHEKNSTNHICILKEEFVLLPISLLTVAKGKPKLKVPALIICDYVYVKSYLSLYLSLLDMKIPFLNSIDSRLRCYESQIRELNFDLLDMSEKTYISQTYELLGILYQQSESLLKSRFSFSKLCRVLSWLQSNQKPQCTKFGR